MDKQLILELKTVLEKNIQSFLKILKCIFGTPCIITYIDFSMYLNLADPSLHKYTDNDNNIGEPQKKKICFFVLNKLFFF